MKRKAIERSIFDHLLAMVGGITATYSIGMSLAKPDLANFLAIAVFISSLVGFVTSQLIRSEKILAIDGYLWALLGIISVTQVFRLNTLLPEEGFPWQLVAGGALSWMIILGSLVSWRDQTLLFLSLPALALFGLVGTFDVYKPGTVFFFLFLVSIAVLYARVHQRTMVERARRNGVEEPRLLWRDAWKWVAGPEWALASAGVIILISIVGAPVLQTSLQGVSGAVRVNLNNVNQARRNPANRTPAEARIGQGPVNLSDRPVFQAVIDQPAYFRRQSFSVYNRGWSRRQLATNNPVGAIISPNPNTAKYGPHQGVQLFDDDVAPIEPIKSETVRRVELIAQQTLDATVMAPGPILEYFEKPNLFSYTNGGTVLLNASPPGGSHILYYYRPPGRPNADDEAELPPIWDSVGATYLDTGAVPKAVRDLAISVTNGAANDLDRARRIQREIENRCLYNTNVSATPSGSDPVEHFLFDAKEGYCDVFASSMVLMARASGLPARYVVGYIINEPTPNEQGAYQIREKDSHAWAEIYFEDKGWVIFDATEGAEAVEGGERGSTSDAAKPWYQREWASLLLNIVIGLALAAPILYYVATRFRLIRMTGRTKHEVMALQDSFQRTIEKHVGHPRRFSQSIREFVELTSPALGPLSTQAKDIVSQLEAALFSRETGKSEDAKLTGKQIREFQQLLKEQQKSRP